MIVLELKTDSSSKEAWIKGFFGVGMWEEMLADGEGSLVELNFGAKGGGEIDLEYSGFKLFLINGGIVTTGRVKETCSFEKSFKC